MAEEDGTDEVPEIEAVEDWSGLKKQRVGADGEGQRADGQKLAPCSQCRQSDQAGEHRTAHGGQRQALEQIDVGAPQSGRARQNATPAPASAQTGPS